MCGFYEDGSKIKKGDLALHKGNRVLILEVNHLKTNKTMDIYFAHQEKKELLNFPYKTITTMQLLQREER